MVAIRPLPVKDVTVPLPTYTVYIYILIHPSPPLKTMNFLLILIFPLLWLLYRIVRWRVRVSQMRRTMPVVPLLVEPYSLLRLLVPKSWQTYHSGWQFQDRRKYDNLGTDIVPLLCLFGNDTVYVADADAVVEIATNINRFPKDLKLYGRSPNELALTIRGFGYLWEEYTYFGGCCLEITSKNHFETLFREK